MGAVIFAVLIILENLFERDLRSEWSGRMVSNLNMRKCNAKMTKFTTAAGSHARLLGRRRRFEKQAVEACRRAYATQARNENQSSISHEKICILMKPTLGSILQPRRHRSLKKLLHSNETTIIRYHKWRGAAVRTDLSTQPRPPFGRDFSGCSSPLSVSGYVQIQTCLNNTVCPVFLRYQPTETPNCELSQLEPGPAVLNNRTWGSKCVAFIRNTTLPCLFISCR